MTTIITPMTEAPPTDKTVLGRNYLFADDDAIKAAIKSLEFELTVRENRRNVAQAIKDQSAARTADVANTIADMEKSFRKADPKGPAS